jgi:hypothetical protein
LLNARVAEHQLNDPNVDAVREQATTRALAAQVVPAEIDPFELFSIPLRPSLPALGSIPFASSLRVSQAGMPIWQVSQSRACSE